MEAKSELDKIEIYKELTKYQNVEDIPIKELSKQFGIDSFKMHGLLGSIRRLPTAYRTMLLDQLLSRRTANVLRASYPKIDYCTSFPV
ncbi:hypothetical protein KEJ21_05355 [Candidatus Bathyarchaeota archaeon]|nr:hypothetical protein [Candidatus Bathyarchaeota archaeon]